MQSRLPRAALALLVACSGQPKSTTSERSAYLGTIPTPAFAATAAIATDQTPPPFSLTASDGSGLVLKRVEAKAVMEGPLAFTELHLTFHNAENRLREGTFSITLPNKAAVSRFAMQNDNGAWMEAEVVEKLKARRAYEDFLHRKQDPALLEKAEGNQFTARVFPIPAKGDKHLVISFSQDLPGERYTLPLRGLPVIEKIDVSLSLLGDDGNTTKQLLANRNWQPDRDFVSTAPANPDAVGAGSLVAAQLTVLDSSGAMPAPDVPTALTILVDTSASRTLGFARTVASLDDMIAGLRRKYGDLDLAVLAFDQTTRPIFTGRASTWSAAARQLLLQYGAAGASDLGQAIAWLRDHQTAASRLVIFGDGVLTAGAKLDEIGTALRQKSGLQRIDFVLSGGLRDDSVATQLVRAGKRPGAVIDADAGADNAVAALGERMLTDVAIDVRGASWVFPRSIPSVRPGSRVMVYARMPQAQQQLDIGINKHRRRVAVVAGTQPLVERALAATEIGELEIKLANATGDQVPALEAEIAKRSVAARVISSQTALLVLETESDYRRYRIDRTALADILEVGADGKVVTRNRKGSELRIAHPEPRVEPERKLGNKQRPVRELEKKRERLEKADGKLKKLEEPEENRSELSKRRRDDDDADDKPVPKKRARRGGEDDDARPSRRSVEKPREVRAPAAPMRDLAAPPPPPPPSPIVVNRAPQTEPTIATDAAPTSPRDLWKNKPAPLQGELADIMKLVASRDTDAALVRARAWHEREPGNLLAWVALGEILEARDEPANAARAYGSIIDLFPGRADLRRWAGERLERIAQKDPAQRALAIDTYTRAVADRPDHMTGHRLLAYALLRANRPLEAFTAILAGIDREYPAGRFNGGDRILREDAGLIGAALVATQPHMRAHVTAELGKRSLAIAAAPSTRFILYWETDANDVDFHIQDARGGHAFYSNKQLPSGGELYADVTNGYGPECFAIPGVPKAGPYQLTLDYYSQGPMGYGMGLLQIVRHDGAGKLTFEDRPYIIMANHAIVDLGTIR